MTNKNSEKIDSDVKSEKRTLPLKAKKRKPGSAKGIITISDDFHKPLSDEEIEKFYK